MNVTQIAKNLYNNGTYQILPTNQLFGSANYGIWNNFTVYYTITGVNYTFS
jgi:hypothetical protein